MLYPYRKSKQIEKYIGQFMRVFAGFQVPQSGVSDDVLIRVPVVYGTMDRVVAALLNNNSEPFTNRKVPIMAVNMTRITPDPTRKLPSTHVDEVVIDDKFYNRLVGVPFLLELELGIYADSQTQLLELVEQILLIFHPRIALQIDSNIMSNEFISEITLESVQPDIQYPLGQNKQVVLLNMSFSMPVTLRYPTEERADFIRQIRTRIFEKSEDTIDDISVLVKEGMVVR